MSRQAHEEPVGYSQITPGFALPADYVLHTVGPKLCEGSTPTITECSQLKPCYTRSLDLLLMTVGDQPNKPISIAFPCISTVAGSSPTTKGWKIIFNTFLKRDYDLYKTYIEGKCPQTVKLPPAPVVSSVESALRAVQDADYLLVSAGAGLSAAAGLDFRSEAVMNKVHPTVHKALPGFRTLYNFIAFRDWDESLMWGFYFKNASTLRYGWTQYRTAPTYDHLKTIVDLFERRRSGSAFIATTNVDGVFAQEGFDPNSVFVMQGDFGKIQCAKPCSHESLWDIKPFMEKGLKSFNPQTYRIEDPEDLPKCPKCGGRMSAFLREDDTFLDSGVQEGRTRYENWKDQVLDQVRNNDKKLVILEVGIGFNTPGVLRVPDEQLALQDRVQLVRVNGEYPDIPFQCHGVEVPEDATGVLDYIAHNVK